VLNFIVLLYIEAENHRYSVLGYRIDAGPGKLESCPFYHNLLSCSRSLLFFHLSFFFTPFPTLKKNNNTSTVVIRAYIAGLRDQLKEYKLQSEIKPAAAAEEDAHAHYHGHEKCTSSHGHEDHDHKAHDHKEHDHKGHDHKGHEHDHGHAAKHVEEDAHAHYHGHEKCTSNHGHEDHNHAANNDSHDHGHGHSAKMDVDEPEWKKRARDSGADALAAPFGGTWTTESSLDATK